VQLRKRAYAKKLAAAITDNSMLKINRLKFLFINTHRSKINYASEVRKGQFYISL
jgi:hypothetical protein